MTTDSPLTIQDIRTLFKKIIEGKVILFLGAGANKGSTNSQGLDAPSAMELAKIIKTHFLPSEDIPQDLPTTCACVEARESRKALDKFLYDTLIDYKPSEGVLRLIPKYTWRRTYTTNFDRLLEVAYELELNRNQNLRPICSDHDIQDFTLGTDLPYYKLHGCITRISDRNLRLILTQDDYDSCRDQRERLFFRFKDDLYENTLLFIGYRLADPNFTSILSEVQKAIGIKDFPRAYAIALDTPPSLVRYYDLKKISILEMTADHFFEVLQTYSTTPAKPEQPYQEEIQILQNKVIPKIDLNVANELFSAFELVDHRLGSSQPNFADFYKGDKPNWSIIKSRGDAIRTCYENIFDNFIFPEESRIEKPFEILIITAEAGAGKSTLLMRIAYDHAVDYDGFCLFHKTLSQIRIQSLEELYRIIKKRVFIYMDDVADNIATLAFLAKRAAELRLPISVIAAERRNEWDVVKERLYPIVPIEVELPFLDDTEITKILSVLEQNNYLCELERMTPQQRKELFIDKAGKQLLVAMREATEGKDFDKIIEDEYDNIPSQIGKQAYLNICALHRLGVAVRAGLIRRLTGVSFEDFAEILFKPCEKVIIDEADKKLGEIRYRARHPYIAEIVCKFALRDPEKIANFYLDILDKLDIGYSNDLYSFKQLVRADEIIDAMPRIEHRRLFYDKALKLAGQDPYVYQQYGIMELRHKNLNEAEPLFQTACLLDPNNNAYKHSYARLLFQKSISSSNPSQKERLFTESQKTLKEIIAQWPLNPYSYDSYASNLIQKSTTEDAKVKQDYLLEAHEVILTGIRKCPDKAHLQATEARIFEHMGELKLAITSLLSAHTSDPTSPRTTLMLSKLWFIRLFSG